jgi:hypothetical protein
MVIKSKVSTKVYLSIDFEDFHYDLWGLIGIMKSIKRLFGVLMR